LAHSSCLYLPGAGITGMNHDAQKNIRFLIVLFILTISLHFLDVTGF
jgi:hypothetical protein